MSDVDDGAMDTGGRRSPNGSGREPAAGREGGKSDPSKRQSDLTGGPNLPSDKASRAAYEGGRRLLSPMTIEASRDAHIHVDKRVMVGLPQVSTAPGPVPDDQITQLRKRYVPVPGLDDMQRALRTRRLLVLVGTPGSGRSSTALWLLDALTNGDVSRLDPTARPFLPGADQIVAAHGYLGSMEPGSALGRVAADRLAADLIAKNSYCVVTAPPSPALWRELGSYGVEHKQAEPGEILEQHVHAAIGPADDDGFDGRMAELASAPETARLLGPAARPAEAAEVAGLLLAYGRHERTWDEVRALAERIVLDDRIEEWFSVLVGVTHGQHADRARRLTAMRIAVAVFDGLPRHIAEGTAEGLAARMAMPPDPPGGTDSQVVLPRMGPRGIDPDEAATLLNTTPIKVAPGEVPYFARTVPGESISYVDDRMPSAVLRCVWYNHYPLRVPVMAWLGDLALDGRQQVRYRAAQAAGLLCALDYTHTLDALVLPAARAAAKPDPTASVTDEDDDGDGDEDGDENEDELFGRRQFAAIAMDHVARDPRLFRFVRLTLRRWRRDADPALRWTAAIAYGYDIGVRDPGAALEELRVLGTPWEMPSFTSMKPKERRRELSVFHAAGAGLAGMFSSGAHREVLAVLHKWSDDDRLSVRLLALQTIIFLTTMMASALGDPEAAGARVDSDRPRLRIEPLLDKADRDERGRWPIVIALHGRQPELQRQCAELIRFALRSPEQTVALKAFEDIFDIAEDFPDTALPAVAAFLPLVIKDESDRGRLLALLYRMRDQWADALSSDVARRLQEVIVGISVVTGKKVYS
jgi:hypothetical protein